MRLALVLIAVLTASAGAAQGAEDRYGPTRAASLRLASNGLSSGPQGPYQGRILNWSSRAFVPQDPQPSLVAAPREPDQASVARSAAPIAVARPPIARSPVAAPQIAGLQPTNVQPAAPAPVRTASLSPTALPDSLYAPPPPVAARQGVAQAATPASAGSRVHLYSVHRQYGLTPDAIAAAPASGSNYVLIEGAQGVGDQGKPADNDDDRPF